MNLYNRIGYKRCALCGCEILELIQGAHIWGVSQISQEASMDDEAKFKHAVDGNNGLWLCQNHHKLFDSNILMLDSNGKLRIKDGLVAKDIAFIRDTTFTTSLDDSILTKEFKWYISKRNENVDIQHSHELVI